MNTKSTSRRARTAQWLPRKAGSKYGNTGPKFSVTLPLVVGVRAKPAVCVFRLADERTAGVPSHKEIE